MSSAPPILPAELWLMIAEYLKDEDSPRHLSRLARTSKWLYSALNDLIYQTVRLERRANARKFAETLRDRPELKGLISEVRHYGDMGFQDFSYFCSTFYTELSTLQNLQTLIMRPKWRKREVRWRHLWECLLYDVYLEGDYSYWDEYVEKFLLALDRAEQMGEVDVDEEFGYGWNPLADDDPADYAFPYDHPQLLAMTSFCGNTLKDSLPALRTCHIGTYSLQKWHDKLTIFFNCSIFYLPQLTTLCITGANFEDVGEQRSAQHPVPNRRPMPVPGCMTNLEELKLLNCRIIGRDLARILSYPAALKKLTLRGPNCYFEEQPDTDTYELAADRLVEYQGSSLISLDLDIYGGSKPGMDLSGLSALTSLTVTQHTVLGVESPLERDFGDVVPSSVESLTLRWERRMMHLPLANLHDSITNGELLNLRTVTLLIPHNIRGYPSSEDLYSEAQSWQDLFKEIEVELQVSLVDYPTRMTKSSVCSCEHLEAYHQFPFHPRVPSDEEIELREIGMMDDDSNYYDSDGDNSWAYGDGYDDDDYFDSDDEGTGIDYDASVLYGSHSGHSDPEDYDSSDERGDSGEHDSAQSTQAEGNPNNDVSNDSQPEEDHSVGSNTTTENSVEKDPVEEKSAEGSPVENSEVKGAPGQESPDEENFDGDTTISNDSIEEDRVEDSDDGFEPGNVRAHPSDYLQALAPRRLLHFNPLCPQHELWINGYGYL